MDRLVYVWHEGEREREEEGVVKVYVTSLKTPIRLENLKSRPQFRLLKPKLIPLLGKGKTKQKLSTQRN